MRRLWATLIFLIVALFGAGASAEVRPGRSTPAAPAPNVPTVVDGTSSLRLGTHLHILVDESAQLTHGGALEADRAGRFVRSKREIPSFGLTSKAVWVRVDFNDARAVPTPLILELSYAPLDRLGAADHRNRVSGLRPVRCAA